MQAEVVAEASKATPPAVVAAAEAAVRDGIGPVGWATILYISLQAAYLLWKWWREFRQARDAGGGGA